MTDWNARYMALAAHVATWSKDRSTKVGSVIIGSEREIVSVGYNGFARGVSDDHPERHERPLKYLMTVHSELNSVLNAGRVGAKILGCTMYVTAMPCANCASVVVNAGINKLFVPKWDRHDPMFDRWREDWEWAEVILREGKVVVTFLERNTCQA